MDTPNKKAIGTLTKSCGEGLIIVFYAPIMGYVHESKYGKIVAACWNFNCLTEKSFLFTYW